MSNIYVPRWYQDEAEYSIFDYFQRGGVGNPVVAMPTGTGKSVVIANFIRRIFGYWPNQRINAHWRSRPNRHKLFGVLFDLADCANGHLFGGLEFPRYDYANRIRRRSVGSASD